jgi:hypothetical protein
MKEGKLNKLKKYQSDEEKMAFFEGCKLIENFLVKYMEHINNEEGSAFLYESELLSEEEVEYLKYL